MVNNLSKDAEKRMAKTVEMLHVDLSKIRTGRAHSGLLDQIKVDYYGSDMPINQVATISVEGPRTLAVTPWEKNLVQAVEKAIRNSDLGLNPSTNGNVIRVPLPSLTEDRRKDLLKVVREEGEQAKVAVRNIRRELNATVKEMLKEKKISEDDESRAEKEIQKVTDKMIGEIDKTVAAKEKDLMEI
jgi:ribosome recycling factor